MNKLPSLDGEVLHVKNSPFNDNNNNLTCLRGGMAKGWSKTLESSLHLISNQIHIKQNGGNIDV